MVLCREDFTSVVHAIYAIYYVLPASVRICSLVVFCYKFVVPCLTDSGHWKTTGICDCLGYAYFEFQIISNLI